MVTVRSCWSILPTPFLATFRSTTVVTDAGLVHLKELTKLTTRYLNDTQLFTDAAITELKQALPNLQIEKW